MKRSLFLLISITQLAFAETWFDTWMDDTSAMAQELCSNWKHEMPDTGMMPSYFSVEITSNMGERHGGSTFQWQQYSLSVPLADPRRSGGENWMFNASFNADVTLVNTSGSLDIRENDLYHFSLPVSLIVPRDNGDAVIAAVSPSLSSDFAKSAHSFHISMMATYRVKHSDELTYSVGLAYSPYAAAWNLMPVVAFDWKITPDWTFSMSGYRLSLMRQVQERVRVGSFLQGEGGSWAVSTPIGTRMLRVRSLVVGVTAEYDFSRGEQAKRIITMSVGSTLTTAVDFCRYNSDRDREASHHYHPGLYFSAGVDFRF